MRILLIEPFYGGSHAAFARTLSAALDAQWQEVTLPARHWKWRMRGSAVFAALERGDAFRSRPDLLLATSFVPLAELVGLRPELADIPRVLYFHENQLAYPSSDSVAEAGSANDSRDLHFAFTQLTSALAATVVVFNSQWNRDSFLEGARALLHRMPDAVPRRWVPLIEARSEVLPVPLDLPDVAPLVVSPTPAERELGPVIAWPHRWEHDKDPAAFVEALEVVAGRGLPFRLVVCGERYRRHPPAFDRLRERFADRIVHMGYFGEREDYLRALATADIVVSTARHEFFGLAMLEATHLGARPLVPNALAYPELYPPQFRYGDPSALADRLEALCRGHASGEAVRGDWRGTTRHYLKEEVVPRYAELFARLIKRARP